jgi:hypothetical protein
MSPSKKSSQRFPLHAEPAEVPRMQLLKFEQEKTPLFSVVFLIRYFGFIEDQVPLGYCGSKETCAG